MAKKPFEPGYIVIKYKNYMQAFSEQLNCSGYFLGDLKSIVDGLISYHGSEAELILETDYDGDPEFYITGKRLETEAEHNKRVADYERAEARRLAAPKTAAEKAEKQRQARIEKVLAEAQKLGLRLTNEQATMLSSRDNSLHSD